MLKDNELTDQIIGSAIEVHRELGPGLLESAYQVCLCRELSLRKVPFESQVSLPIQYKGVPVDANYQMDLFVDRRIVVELKAVTEMHPVFEAQLITYMKLSGSSVGLLINFNVPLLKNGITRRVL